MRKIIRIINRIIKMYQIINVPSYEKIVYLTFDDGPEPGISEFVLEQLMKYDYHATFFCRGDNAEKYHELLTKIRKEGHAIANHTFSHLHAYDVSASEYLKNVEKANAVLQTQLFRPPKGDLTLLTFLGIRKKYKIFYWAINSEDSAKENFNFQHAIEKLKTKTKSGDVVLFHFCLRHEKETRQILPAYLEWLNQQGYISKALS